MKNIIVAFMLMAMVLSMAACGKKEEKPTASAAPATVVVDETKDGQEKPAEKEETEQPAEQESEKEIEKQVTELVEQVTPLVQTQQKTPTEDESQQEEPTQNVSPLLQRNTEMEKKLEGTWYETVDFGEEMGKQLGSEVEAGRYVLEMSYTYESGQMTIAYDEAQMKAVMKAMMAEIYTKMYAEQGTTLEEAGFTDEYLDDLAGTTVGMMKMSLQPVEYAVYDENVLWHAGVREGEIIEITENCVVVQHDDGRQTIMTRG